MSLCNIFLVRKYPSIVAPAFCGSRFWFFGLTLLSFIILDSNLKAQSPDVTQIDVASINCNFNIQASLQNPRCFGQADGRITLLGSATDGTGLSYRWINLSNTNTSNQANDLAAGSYEVEVSNEDCIDTLAFQLNNPPALIADNLHKSFCTDGANVDLLEGVSGGTGTLSFTLETFSGTEVSCVTCTSSTIFFDENSLVFVEIEDENGCVASRFVLVEFFPALTVNLTIRNETCVDDGQIEVLASGGTGEYFYNLGANDSFQSSNIFSNLNGGTTYTVNVQDANASCQTTATATVGLSPVFEVPNITWTNASCFGQNDGVINVELQIDDDLQVALDSIDSNTPVVDATIFENVAPGMHTVIVQKSGVCTQMYDVFIDQPEQMDVQLDFISELSCPGENDAEVALTIDGGTPVYDVFLDGTFVDLSQDNPVISGLAAGLHVVSVFDINGCEETKSFTIEEEEEPDLGSMTFPSCPGENSGSIVIVEAGKLLVGNYAFSLDSVVWQSENLFENLVPGAYTAYIQYPDGCVFEVPFNIEEVIPPEVELTLEHVSCPSGSDGTASVQITNGSNTAASFQYSLDSVNFSNISLFENLTAGNYTLYVRDINPCIFTFSFAIEEPDSLIMGLNVQNASCPGSSDGQITIGILTGGTSPFEYALNNGNFQDSNIFDNLAAGNYIAMVRDSNGCLYLNEAMVAEPSGIDPNLQVDHSTCGEKNGLVICNPIGGTPPYAYNWNTGDSAAFIHNLDAGYYQVSVMDANDCLGTEEITVEDIGGPLLLADVEDVDCFGEDNGQIDLSVVEGTAPFQYSWSNGSYSQDLVALQAGSYIVTVIDFNQCTNTKSYTIHEPAPLEISSQVGPSGDYWFINLIVEGGMPPYEYEWSNGASSQDIFNLHPGTYTVMVTDAQGCADHLEIDVGITAVREPDWADNLQIFPNPTNGLVQIRAEDLANQSALIAVFDLSGKVVLAPQALKPTLNLSSLPSGLYILKIEEEDGFLYRRVIKQ